MDHYYEMTNVVPQSHDYQPLESAHNADDKELKQLLLDERDSPAASRPKELDQWFSQVYEYYSQKGLACILTCQVLDISTIAATWFFSGFVMMCIDWAALGRCSECMSENEVECKDVCRNIVTSPNGGALYSAVVFSYLMVLMAYLAYRAMVLAKDLKSWVNMQRFFNDDLGITDSELQAIEWAVVTQRIISLQNRFRSKFIKEFHDEHDITSRILRKDNYMIALVEGPLQGAMHVDHPWLNALMGPKCLTHTLEWNLRICLLDRMFDEDYRVDPHFLQSEHSLRQTFYVAGLVNLLLSPFIVMFVLVYFALKNAQRYHADPRSLSTRSWCLYAKYTFRKYNELPHCFQRRLNKAVPWAEKYIQQFASPLLSVYARFAAFLFSSLLAILIALWVINEQMMKLDFYFMGMNRNLYWYMGIFAMGLGMARSFIIQHSNPSEAHEPLLSCISYTNYFPRHWRELRLTSIEVHDEFSDLFMLNVAIPGLHRSIFVQEMLGVIVTPFILWFVLPDRAGEILAFLRRCTVEKRAVNCVCAFADFSRDGFTRYGGMPHDPDAGRLGAPPGDPDDGDGLSHDGGGRASVGASAGGISQGAGGVQPADSKFHKSFVGFKANNPLWEPPQEGQQLLCRLMETVELRSDMDLEARRPGPLVASAASGRASACRRDPVSAANAAAAFISSSHFLPPEEAEGVQCAVLQRFKAYGTLIGGAHPPPGWPLHSPPPASPACGPRPGVGLGLSSGARWGFGGRGGESVDVERGGGGCGGGYGAAYGAAMSGRQLEMDEHLLNVLLMEYSEMCAAGVLAPPPPAVGTGDASPVEAHPPPAVSAAAGAGLVFPDELEGEGRHLAGPAPAGLDGSVDDGLSHGGGRGGRDGDGEPAPCSAPFAS